MRRGRAAQLVGWSRTFAHSGPETLAGGVFCPLWVTRAGRKEVFYFSRDKIAEICERTPLETALASQHGPADYVAAQHLRRLHRSPRPERLCFNYALHHVHLGLDIVLFKNFSLFSL